MKKKVCLTEMLDHYNEFKGNIHIAGAKGSYTSRTYEKYWDLLNLEVERKQKTLVPEELEKKIVETYTNNNLNEDFLEKEFATYSWAAIKKVLKKHNVGSYAKSPYSNSKKIYMESQKGIKREVIEAKRYFARI